MTLHEKSGVSSDGITVYTFRQLRPTHLRCPRGRRIGACNMAKTHPLVLILGGLAVTVTAGAVYVALTKEQPRLDALGQRARAIRAEADARLLAALRELETHPQPLIQALATRAAELLVSAWIALGRSGDHAPSWLPARLYGEYGGGGSSSLAPVDALDALFAEHDRAYDLAARIEVGLAWA
ncbi:MAG: hypothetical protein JNK05_11630 [Myxococcales bacterium]|nr:hypothetical protein [Myxococcales bacterium]